MPWETCERCKSGAYYSESMSSCRYCDAELVRRPLPRADAAELAMAAREAEAAERSQAAPPPFDLLKFYDQRAEWSAATFGPGDRAKGVVAHIRKELVEIEAQPDDLEEWVDLVFLAMDGAWRSAKADGPRFVAALLAKHAKNAARTWPDWRAAGPDQPIEHVRTAAELDGTAELPADPADLTREHIVAAAERSSAQATLTEPTGVDRHPVGDHLHIGKAETCPAATCAAPAPDQDPDRFVRAAAVGERVQRVQIATGAALDALGEALGVHRHRSLWPQEIAPGNPVEDDASYRRRLRQAAAAEFHAGARRVAYQTGEDFAHEVLSDVHAGAAAARAADVRAKTIAEIRTKVDDILDEITEVAELCAAGDGDTPRADLVVNVAGVIRERIIARLVAMA